MSAAPKLFPDFIIGGAPRSGTTWLYVLLQRHPNIYMAEPIKPEPKFFLVDELYARGLDYYRAVWFSRVACDQVSGEKSTNYLESPLAAERIHKHLPQVKLVFILREPVARAYSNYLWSRMNGLEDKDFATALSLERERDSSLPAHLRYARPHAYFSRGLYAGMLSSYFALFPKEQILCLRYEDIIQNLQELAFRLHSFLGVPTRPDDAVALGNINPSNKDQKLMSPEVRQQLIEAYSKPNEQLAQLMGDRFEIWEYK